MEKFTCGIQMELHFGRCPNDSHTELRYSKTESGYKQRRVNQASVMHRYSNEIKLKQKNFYRKGFSFRMKNWKTILDKMVLHLRVHKNLLVPNQANKNLCKHICKYKTTEWCHTIFSSWTPNLHLQWKVCKLQWIKLYINDKNHSEKEISSNAISLNVSFISRKTFGLINKLNLSLNIKTMMHIRGSKKIYIGLSQIVSILQALTDIFAALTPEYATVSFSY